MNTILHSPKFDIMFEILKQCQRKEEKCLIFSSSVVCLDTVEYFLSKNISWKKTVDYYRLDGSTKNEKRHEMIVQFNRPENKQVKLFLISAKAGGQGINLTGANRIILLDTSWNPSVDRKLVLIYTMLTRLIKIKICFVRQSKVFSEFSVLDKLRRATFIDCYRWVQWRRKFTHDLLRSKQCPLE